MPLIDKPQAQTSSSIAIFVIWQSLVVRAYRSFFAQLAQQNLGSLALAAPDQFIELGHQQIRCQSFEPPFTAQSPHHPSFILKTWTLHVQIVLFWGLRRAFKTFFSQTKKTEKKLVLCMAEPYSITAFWVWLQARLCLGRGFTLILYTAQNIYKDLPLLLRWVQRFMFSECAAILCVGGEQQSVLRRHGFQGPCLDFPLWFDSGIFYPKLQTEKSPQRLRIGFAGALNKQKGLFDLLDSLERMSNHWSAHCSLEIAGKGELQKDIESYVKVLRNTGWQIELLGALKLEEMSNFYNRLDILVVPSRTMSNIKEQFGRVIIEAQACGVLVIGSNSGAIPQVIANPSRIFKEGDIRDLTSVLGQAIVEVQKASSEFRSLEAQKAFERFSDVSLAKQFAEQLSQLS